MVHGTQVEDDVQVDNNEMLVHKRTTEFFLEKSFSRSIPRIRLKQSMSAKFGNQLVDEALKLVKENVAKEDDNLKIDDGHLTLKRPRQQIF